MGYYLLFSLDVDGRLWSFLLIILEKCQNRLQKVNLKAAHADHKKNKPHGILNPQLGNLGSIQVFCNFSGSHVTMCLMSGCICLVPLSFLAFCIWLLLVVLPSRLQSGNASFLSAYSFLILRFKPGYEAFTVAFLLRNLCLVLTPMVHSSSGLLMMGILLSLSLTSVAHFNPWRTDLANQLDVLVSLVLLMILVIGSLTVEDSELQSLMFLSTVCGCLIIFALLMGAFYSIFLYIAAKLRKKFAFFLSHHRSASAATARLLSLELKRRGFSSFIDSDNLTDLSRLFSYVSHDTQTFVLIGTPLVLKRKWCMGELVMARLAQLEVVLLSFPDFSLLEERFIRNYQRVVPDIGELAMYGLGIADVQQTLRWLGGVTTYSVASISKENLGAIVSQLTGTSVKDYPQGTPTDYDTWTPCKFS